MILATGSLILTTTNRLVRIIDRVRETLPELEQLAKEEKPDDAKYWASFYRRISHQMFR